MAPGPQATIVTLGFHIVYAGICFDDPRRVGLPPRNLGVSNPKRWEECSRDTAGPASHGPVSVLHGCNMPVVYMAPASGPMSQAGNLAGT